MRPNILFLMADQFRGDILGCAGGPAKTPNLDLLAREGIRFTNCSTTAPLCIPARIALFSGKYAHTTGAWDNDHYVLSPDASLWSRKLHDLGYASALFGKTHLHGGGGDIISREHLVRSYGFDTVNETTGPHAASRDDIRTHLTEEWKEKGLYEAFRNDVHRRRGPEVCPSPLPLEDYYDVYVGNHGNEFLENYQGDKPWFCHISFGGPHEPWDSPEPYASLYQPSDMPSPIPRMTNAEPARPRGKADERMELAHIQCTPDMALKLRADYCGNVTLIDDMIGKVFETIRRRGEWDNTIILFTSDHGEMNGDHGFVFKHNFLNSALNVPLLIRTPETAARGGHMVSDALVSLMDVGPTLLELAGGAIDYEQCGKSLCGILNGTETAPRSYVLSELFGEIMYMDAEWKAAFNRQGEIYLLFDRRNDPDEQLNLAGSASAQSVETVVRDRFIRALMENQCIIPAVTQAEGL